ncbi:MULTISPECIES: ImmA/IrrE family metallo-endopeptidase [Streptomyces]|uniref:ImmA/IrrE family metallo-endopeptidase n=1 Tax=Streptomyces TaxID=1883 RepID=UPI0013DF112F|nr:ImmA/IrrE family metallo-endopeptidase [Streptomyces sp. W1SF4]
MAGIRKAVGIVVETVREIRTLRRLRNTFCSRLGLPAHPTIDEVVSAVSGHCGMPIRILQLPLTYPLTGGLLQGPGELIVVVDKDSPSILQSFVIAHELAHAFLGHDPQTAGHDLQDELLASLAPALNPKVARMMLARTYFDGAEPSRSHGQSPPEREAETLGRLIVSMITNTGGNSATSASSALRHRGTGV